MKEATTMKEKGMATVKTAVKGSSTLLEARVLSGAMIGTPIRFRVVHQQRGVVVVVTGELRQLFHNLAETTVRVGLGAEDEWRLDGDQPVSLAPPADYSDVPLLEQAQKMLDQSDRK